MELYILLALIYFSALSLGVLLERFRIPWIFSALFLGVAFKELGLFSSSLSSSTFDVLSNLGMLFMLFIIGFEIDVREIIKQGKFIIESTLFITLFAALLGVLLLYYGFHYSFIVSLVVSLSFATVGEAVLIPILDELKIVRTKLGELIISIGTMDDAIEIVALLLVSAMIGTKSSINIENTIIALTTLLLLTILLIKSRRFITREFGIRTIKYHLLGISLLVFFLFLAIGKYAEATAIAALLSGITLSNFLPRYLLEKIESEIRILAYGFFGPIFFLWVGATISLSSVVDAPLLAAAIFFVASVSKIVASVLASSGKIGFKPSLLLGTGLCVRFSTSLVIVKILYEAKVIDLALYSALVTVSAISTVAMPLIFAYLSKRWRELLK